MKTLLLIIFLALAGTMVFHLALTHGSAAAQEPKVSICHHQECGLCYEYLGDGWVMEAEKKDCANIPGGIYKNIPCPSENLVGYCTYRPSGEPDMTVILYYYKPIYNEESARNACPGKDFKVWNK